MNALAQDPYRTPTWDLARGAKGLGRGKIPLIDDFSRSRAGASSWDEITPRSGPFRKNLDELSVQETDPRGLFGKPARCVAHGNRRYLSMVPRNRDQATVLRAWRDLPNRSDEALIDGRTGIYF